MVLRKYSVRFSAHGLRFLPLIPKNYDKTLEEAEGEVEDWRNRADTVGGDAVIVTEEDNYLVSY